MYPTNNPTIDQATFLFSINDLYKFSAQNIDIQQFKAFHTLKMLNTFDCFIVARITTNMIFCSFHV